MTTKDRILDAAERLFARDGFEATSLRAITAEARANLAAVNYHFQSKEALVQAVIGRRMGPVNQQRLSLLDAYEAEAGGDAVPLEKILDAFLRPVIEIAGGHAKEFVPLVGRLYTEPGGFSERLYQAAVRTPRAPVHSSVTAGSAGSAGCRVGLAHSLCNRRDGTYHGRRRDAAR